MLGRKPTVGATLGSAEVLLVEPLRTFQLGTTGENGVAGSFTLFGQARVTLQGGATRFTNSVPPVVQ